MMESCVTNLEFIPSIRIKGSVVVEDIDEWKFVTGPSLIIVSVMGGSNLHSPGTELHVDDNRVGDNWYSAVNERVDGKFSVKMLRAVRRSNTQKGSRALTVYLGSSGWTAIAVSPSIVSGLVVAMMIFSSVKHKRGNFYFLKVLT